MTSPILRRCCAALARGVQYILVDGKRRAHGIAPVSTSSIKHHLAKAKVHSNGHVYQLGFVTHYAQ